MEGVVVHKRVRPVVHQFRYKVFYLRFPLSRLATLENAVLKRNRFGLMGFYDADHGERRAGADLRAWAQGVLHAHGVTDADGEIELQCFPRVLGYVFNPVSFWYCYRAQGGLRAVIAEVNNTFGERHCYLLEAQTASSTPACTIPNGALLSAQKTFHVSPFFPIEGGYRFRFLRTAQPTTAVNATTSDRNVARIDYADAGGDLLHTSVSGTAQPYTAHTLLRALMRYPLFTFGVVARIHWQALRLWLKRATFYSKPAAPLQPVTHSITHPISLKSL
jgi:uncharacterized protein